MRSDDGKPIGEEFFPLDVQNLRLDVTTNFAMYLKRGDGRPVLYRGKNTKFTGEILDNLRRNNVQFLYVPAEDWGEYEKYLAEHLNELVDDPNIPIEKKCEVTYEAANSVMEKAFDENSSPEETIAASKKVFEPMAKVMLGGAEAAKKFVALTSEDYELYTKSVNVCIIGMLLVRRILNITDSKKLLEIGAGFLLCDLAKKNWPKEILDRRGTLLPAEWDIVKQHPLESLEMVKDLPLSDEARIIIEQHHERSDGSGYPKGLKGDQIHVLAKIASLADTFVALNSKRPFSERKKTFDALKIIRDELHGHVDIDLFAEFVQIFAMGNPLEKRHALPPKVQEKKSSPQPAPPQKTVKK